MTTLYEHINMSKNDFDTYDTEYDASVTVCYIDEETDEYDKFCNNIIKKVNVVEINEDSLVVDWSNLIERNMSKFKGFSTKHWINQYEDDEEEFVYQWINEIHLYMAGYVDEGMYKILNRFVDSIV